MRILYNARGEAKCKAQKFLPRHNTLASTANMREVEFEIPTAKERTADQAWIRQNMQLFAPLARDGYAGKGRGALAVNIAELVLRLHFEEGHPFNYHPSHGEWLETANAYMPESERLDLLEWFDHYNPDTELLILLYKFERVSAHRLPLPSSEDLEDEIRGAYVLAESEERQNRLACSDFWARDFRLAAPYLPFWKDRTDS